MGIYNRVEQLGFINSSQGRLEGGATDETKR
jgi:hypothetical protein